jgi:hypothetical protein
VPSELQVSLNDARNLMAVPRLAKILACGISKCDERHCRSFVVYANGEIELGSC